MEKRKPAALVLWCATFACLAFVPDLKLLRYKLLAVESGVWLLWAGLLAAALSGRLKSWARTPLDAAVAAYAAAAVLFYLSSPERSVSLPELMRMLFCAATFFAATQTLGLAEKTNVVLAFWSLTAGLLGLYAGLELRGGVGILSVPLQERPFATFGNPIFLAAYLSASLFVILGRLRSTASASGKALYSSAAAACAWGLWAAQSRAAFAGLAAAALLLPRKTKVGRRRVFAAAGVSLAACAAAAWWFRDRQWTHWLIWRDAARLWLAHPVFGCGLGRFHVEFPDYASEALKALWPQQKVIINFPHNEYLQVLTETGVVGAAALGAVVWSALFKLPQDDAGLKAAAAALLAQALFSPDLRFGVSSFILFFCLGAAAARCSRVESPPLLRPGALLMAAALPAWGAAVWQPFFAQRRLAREPGFHIQGTPEVQSETDRLEARLRAEPRDLAIAESLAYLYAKEQRWPQAVSRYELAASLDPGRPGPYNNLGNIYYMTGNRSRAVEYWEKSLAVKPDQLDAHLNLGKTLFESGRLKESAAHLQAALRLDPNNEKARILLKKMVE